MCIVSNKTTGMFAFTSLAIHTKCARVMIHFTCMHERQKSCVHLKQQSGCAAVVLEPTSLSHSQATLCCCIYQRDTQLSEF